MTARFAFFILLISTLSGISDAQMRSLEKDDRDQVTYVRVYHIFKSSRSDAQKLFYQLQVTAARAPLEPFKTVARRESEDAGSAHTGGDLGLIYEGQMDISFERAVMKLPIGQLSEPFMSAFGWHLALVTERTAAPVAQVCEESLKRSIKVVDLKTKKALEISQKRNASSEYVPYVASLLGPDWSQPLGQGEDAIFLRSVNKSEDRRVLFVHLEKAHPALVTTAMPIACYRSLQMQYTVDCAKRALKLDGARSYEGRAGLGRVLRTAPVDDRLSFEPARDSTAGAQYVDYACGIKLAN